MKKTKPKNQKGKSRVAASKKMNRNGLPSVLGCLQKELAGRSVDNLMNELRGPVEVLRSR